MIIGGMCAVMVVTNVVIMIVFEAHEPTLDHMCAQSVFIHCMALTVNSSYFYLQQQLIAMKMYCVFCEVGN